MKWKALPMPEGIVKSEGSDENYGRFEIGPLERGWGVTIGNALRRVLLSSLQGAAVISVKIDGVSHEFDTLDGVKEDVAQIILNIKKLRLKLITDDETTLRLDVSGEGDVTAANIEPNSDVEILNPDLHIATLGENGSLTIEFRVADGRGYVNSEELVREEDPIGTIALDANFSPVVKVSYEVSDTRVGQRTDFNSLIVEIWTDGSLDPEDAMAYSSKLLVDHLEMFINFEGELESAHEEIQDDETDRLINLLKMRVDELELSVRSSNCLRLANIHTLADLVKNPESDMLKYKNFGRKSLIELNEVLGNLGLHFGMKVDKLLGSHS
ncbi:MAG: DNA-directed RNA polymerase subunit alpha [Fibrobacteria bacterium]|nr:DNA-directed RNA polymerase subunit alpha [Fibrobacteria bacterium]